MGIAQGVLGADFGEDVKTLDQVLISSKAIIVRKPFSGEKTKWITLTNPSDKTIIFTVVTTGPNLLANRREMGILRGKRKIHVRLQLCRMPKGVATSDVDCLTFILAVWPENEGPLTDVGLLKERKLTPRANRAIEVLVAYVAPKNEGTASSKEGDVRPDVIKEEMQSADDLCEDGTANEEKDKNEESDENNSKEEGNVKDDIRTNRSLTDEADGDPDDDSEGEENTDQPEDDN
ncbi:unnamed protein product [Soboliphyme baturini]|uniref:MSP domain-containing protein n=1 Tax=Soboliphyme baturini TaxID=241478 RepID=A0A183IUF5_9BILA|nr:unnamed protein product [Soboliphyme baturini]